MSRRRSLWIGAVTLLTVIYLGALLEWGSGWLLSAAQGEADLASPVTLLFSLGNCAGLLVMLGLVYFYFRDLPKNPRLSPGSRSLWMVLLVLGSPFSMVVYWILYLRPGASPDSHAPPPAP
jgi:hypothetical protein